MSLRVSSATFLVVALFTSGANWKMKSGICLPGPPWVKNRSMRQHHAHEYTLRIPVAATRPVVQGWKTMHKGLENINFSLRGFVRRFYVSNLEEFSFRRKRQYSYDERFSLKWRGNCERNFDGAFSSSCKTTFFWVYNGKPNQIAYSYSSSPTCAKTTSGSLKSVKPFGLWPGDWCLHFKKPPSTATLHRLGKILTWFFRPGNERLNHVTKEMLKIIQAWFDFLGYFFHKNFRFRKKSRFENSRWAADNTKTTSSRRSSSAAYLEVSNRDYFQNWFFFLEVLPTSKERKLAQYFRPPSWRNFAAVLVKTKVRLFIVHAKKKSQLGSQTLQLGYISCRNLFFSLLPIQITFAPESNVFTWLRLSMGSKVFDKSYKNVTHQGETRNGHVQTEIWKIILSESVNPLKMMALLHRPEVWRMHPKYAEPRPNGSSQLPMSSKRARSVHTFGTQLEPSVQKVDGYLYIIRFEVAIRLPAPYKMSYVRFRAFKSPPIWNALRAFKSQCICADGQIATTYKISDEVLLLLCSAGGIPNEVEEILIKWGLEKYIDTFKGKSILISLLCTKSVRRC